MGLNIVHYFMVSVEWDVHKQTMKGLAKNGAFSYHLTKIANIHEIYTLKTIFKTLAGLYLQISHNGNVEEQ